MAETKNQKPHAHLHMIRKQSIKFQISQMKDVKRTWGQDRKGERNDGPVRLSDAHTDGRLLFLSPPPPTSGVEKDMNSR